MRVAAVRFLCSMGALAVGFTSSLARAEEPDGGLALIVGAASSLAGMVVGGALVTTNHASDVTRNAGWLTIESGFTLAPFAAPGAVGEWGRGALFAAAPAAALGGTATLFGLVPNTIDQGSLEQQRLMWGLFVAGQIASVAGVVDAALAPWRAKNLVIAPSVGAGRAGVEIGGVF
jgi:hypothetical protein